MSGPKIGIDLGLNSASFEANARRASEVLKSTIGGMDKDLARTESIFGRFTKNSGTALQQLGYQVGDFASQVAGGQSALVAFAQQGSQFAGLFGPGGAIAGALLGVGTILVSKLVPGLGDTGTAALTARDRLLDFANGFDTAKEKADQFIAKLKELDSAQLAVPQAQAASEQKAAEGVQRLFGRFAGRALPSGAVSITPGRDPEVDQAASEVEAERRRRVESRGRDLVKEREQNLAWRRDLSADALRAEQERTRIAKAAADERARIAEREQKAIAASLERQQNAVAQFHKLLRTAPRINPALNGPITATENANRAALGRDPLSTRIEVTENANRAAMQKIWQDQIDEQTKVSQRFADLQSDILIEPWRNVASEVQGITQDMFDQVLEDGKVSFGSLADSFTDVFRQTASGALAAVVNAPIQQAVAQLGAKLSDPNSGFGATLLQFTQDNPIISGLAVGGTAGSVFSSLLGQQGKYAGVGGAVGGAAGGYAGSALMPFLLTNPYTAPLAPFAPLIGSVLGGLGGGALGGLFGGENNLGNDRSTQTYSSGQGKIVYSDRSFSQGNRNVTSGILGEVQTLQEALKDLGASFSDFNLRVEAGNKSGIAVNGVKYDTAQDALKGAIEQLLGARTGGLTTTQQTILANTKGETAQQIGQDLAFGETYDRLTSHGNQFDLALRDLQKSMEAARVTAAKLGLSVEAIDQAFAEGAVEIARQRDQATRGVWEQMAAARGDTSLRTQLHMLETQMRELAKTAADLGVPFEEVTRTHQIAADRLVQTYYENIQAMQAQQRGLQQSILDARRGAVGAVDQYLDPIKAALGSQGIGRGVYAGTVTTASAVDEFRALLGMAREGDTSALSQLSGAGQAAVQAARQTYGAGTEFAKVFREIEAGLKDQEGRLEAKRDQVLAQIGTYTEQTVDELVRLRIESIAELQRQFERLSSDIRAAIEGAN